MTEYEIALHTERPIAAAAIQSLYDNAKWWPERQVSAIDSMLAHGVAVGVWNGDDLIAFARAVSDGVFRAYVEDVVVQEPFRKQGVGDKLIARLMDELSHIDVISLFCEEELVPFYQKHRFKNTRQVVMHRSKKS